MATNVKKSTSTAIKWCIALIVPLVFFLIPISDVYTPQIRMFLVLTLMAMIIVAFELLPYVVPGVLLPTAYLMTGLAPANVAFAGWGSTFPWMILGAFVLSAIMLRTGLLTRLAYWCILKLGGSFRNTCIALLLIGPLVFLATNANGYIIIAIICIGIAKSFNIELKSKESVLLFLAGTLGSLSATCYMPNATNLAMLISGGKTVVPDFTMSYGGYVLHNLPYVIFPFLFFFIMWKIIRPNVTTDGTAAIQTLYKKMGPITKEEKKTAVVLIILLVFLFTGGIHKMDVTLAFIFLPWVFWLPGMNIGTRDDIQSCDISALVFAVMCMSIGVVAQTLGVTKLFADMVMGVLGGKSPILFIFIVAVLGIILNLLLTPMAVVGAFSSVFAQLATTLGVAILPTFYTLCMSMDQVIMPYEFVAYLIFFAYGFCKMGDFIKVFTLKTVLHLVFLMVVMVPYWSIIGIL